MTGRGERAVDIVLVEVDRHERDVVGGDTEARETGALVGLRRREIELEVAHTGSRKRSARPSYPAPTITTCVVPPSTAARVTASKNRVRAAM